MNLSEYQINSVIKTYMKNLKARASRVEDEGEKADEATLSKEGIKRVLLERIGEKITKRLKGYQPGLTTIGRNKAGRKARPGY